MKSGSLETGVPREYLMARSGWGGKRKEPCLHTSVMLVPKFQLNWARLSLHLFFSWENIFFELLVGCWVHLLPHRNLQIFPIFKTN